MDSTLVFLVVGLLQGVLEWLPVSSEGVNTLVLASMGFDPRSLIPATIWLHLGTLLAAALYFRRDIVKLAKSVPRAFKSGDGGVELLAFIAVATIITCILGLPLYVAVKGLTLLEGSILMALVGCFLIVNGLIQKLAKERRVFREDVRLRDAILLGVVQSLSVIPGLSRSGLTVSTLLLCGYGASTSLKLSFIVSIPVVAVADAYLALSGEVASFTYPSLIGVLAAFVVGYATISLLMKLARRLRFWAFCIAIGALSFIPLILELLKQL